MDLIYLNLNAFITLQTSNIVSSCTYRVLTQYVCDETHSCLGTFDSICCDIYYTTIYILCINVGFFFTSIQNLQDSIGHVSREICCFCLTWKKIWKKVLSCETYLQRGTFKREEKHNFGVSHESRQTASKWRSNTRKQDDFSSGQMASLILLIIILDKSTLFFLLKIHRPASF